MINIVAREGAGNRSEYGRERARKLVWDLLASRLLADPSVDASSDRLREALQGAAFEALFVFETEDNFASAMIAAEVSIVELLSELSAYAAVGIAVASEAEALHAGSVAGNLGRVLRRVSATVTAARHPHLAPRTDSDLESSAESPLVHVASDPPGTFVEE